MTTLPGYTGPTQEIADGRPVVSVIGGGGHVGLPFAEVLADSGFISHAIDTNPQTVALVNSGRMPFIEEGAQEVLDRVLGNTLFVQHPGGFADAYRLSDTIIITVGTPLDKYGNPRMDAILSVAASLVPHLRGQLVILRSTVFPGTTERIAKFFREQGAECDVAFCPERIVQGQAIVELKTLPQIVSGVTPRAAERAAAVFEKLGVKTEVGSVAAAELAKLGLNGWRYTSFAYANDLYGVAEKYCVAWSELERLMKNGYPRGAAMPSPGFAAGPCLYKDTMQLVAASPNGFPIGRAAAQVNEGLPDIIAGKLRAIGGAVDYAVIGILGMAFKADNDDTRDSLSFKLKKLLELAGRKVLCSDEYAHRDGWVTKEELIERSQVVIVGVPHAAYHGLHMRGWHVDLWGVVKGDLKL
jgi:UDP-N-acetyl-D-mannosaminuronic acid dehydrogenase